MTNFAGKGQVAVLKTKPDTVLEDMQEVMRLGAAYLLVQRADKEGHELKLSTGEGMRLGMLVLGMLRQVSRLGEGKD